MHGWKFAMVMAYRLPGLKEQAALQIDLQVLDLTSMLVQGDYLAGFTPVTESPSHNCGLQRLEHAVGNVNNLIEALDYVSGFTGFHE